MRRMRRKRFGVRRDLQNMNNILGLGFRRFPAVGAVVGVGVGGDIGPCNSSARHKRAFTSC